MLDFLAEDMAFIPDVDMQIGKESRTMVVPCLLLPHGGRMMIDIKAGGRISPDRPAAGSEMNARAVIGGAHATGKSIRATGVDAYGSK